MRRNRNACKVQERWREIYIQNHLISHRAGRDALRISHLQRYTNRWLMHQAFIEEPPFAKEVSVIGTLHNCRILQNVFLLEILQYATDIFVDSNQARIVILRQSFQ